MVRSLVVIYVAILSVTEALTQFEQKERMRAGQTENDRLCFAHFQQQLKKKTCSCT